MADCTHITKHDGCYALVCALAQRFHPRTAVGGVSCSDAGKGYFSFSPLTNTEVKAANTLIPHPISRRPHLPIAVSPVSPGQGSGDRSLRDALKKVISDHADEASVISL